ncbi:MAG: Tat pathway signal protein [Melioribacter sp.]|nr:Tat pathway signal protein [Melioribacter sp.]
MQKLICLLLIGFFSNVVCQSRDVKYLPYNKIEFKLTQKEKAFLDTLQYKSFLYFINEINPVNGLVKDRSTDTSPATIAAVGFAVPIWAIGSEKGWITREQSVQYTLSMLNFFWNSEQSTESLATGYKGFYYHFLDMKSGKRFWNCELSSIDSGLLYCGIIFARQYYNGNDEKEKQIRELSTKLLERVDWKFFTMSATGPYANTISLGWDLKGGFNKLGWWGYTEALFLYIISAGMDMPDVEKGYDTWLKTYQWRKPYSEKLGHVVFPSMFIHQFSFLWLDGRGLIDRYMQKKGIDYFENSRRATYVQREYALANINNWNGYDSLTWGLTACDGPDKNYNGKQYWGYSARGTSGPDSTFDDGTIAPTAAGGSIPFAPEITIPALMNMNDKYGSKGLWGKYGFVDAFNPTLNWYDKDYLGLDQGPIIIMIENYFNGFVWKYFMKDPIVKKGLVRLGFKNK